MQKEMPFLSATTAPVLAPDDLIRKCRHRLDAIRLCVQLSGFANDTISRALGIDKGHWTRIMQGKAWFPDTKSVDLMMMCGNYAPMQFEALKCGFELFKDTKAQRKAELIAELQQLEAAA